MSDQLIEKMNSNKVEQYSWEEYKTIENNNGTFIIESCCITGIIEFIFLVDGKQKIGLTSV